MNKTIEIEIHPLLAVLIAVVIFIGVSACVMTGEVWFKREVLGVPYCISR